MTIPPSFPSPVYVDWYVNEAKWISSQKPDLNRLGHTQPSISSADRPPRTGNIRKACLNGSINPISPLHMHPCGLGPKPASVIIVLWYCHYSIFPPSAASTSIPVPEERMFKSLSIQSRRKKGEFSHRVWSWKMYWMVLNTVFWPAVMPGMKSNLVQWISGKLDFLLLLISRSLIEDCPPIWHAVGVKCNSLCYQHRDWRIILR